MKLLIIVLLILNFGIANSQNYEIGDSLFVNANGGLNLREEANAKSKIISLLNYGESVYIKSKLENREQLKIGWMNGNWVEIKTNKYEGFVFDSYLSKLPVIELDENNEFKEHTLCFVATMRNYISKQLGIIDTTTYTNCDDGNSIHIMEIYDLNGGHQYIEHEYWEGYMFEFQLVNIRDSEGIQLIKNIFQDCEEYTPKIAKSITEVGSEFYPNMTEVCCEMSTQRIGDKFVIRVMGEP